MVSKQDSSSQQVLSHGRSKYPFEGTCHYLSVHKVNYPDSIVPSEYRRIEKKIYQIKAVVFLKDSKCLRERFNLYHPKIYMVYIQKSNLNF